MHSASASSKCVSNRSAATLELRTNRISDMLSHLFCGDSVSDVCNKGIGGAEAGETSLGVGVEVLRLTHSRADTPRLDSKTRLLVE